MSNIIIGEWLYDEKKEPELAKQDQHRPKKPRRERGKQGQQLIVSRELLKSGHTALRGRTGSGKTARGFLPLILQIMQEYTLYWALANGMGESQGERDAIVVIDLAGDKPMFHAVRKMAKKLGRKFGQLALDPTKSQPFDMFQTVGIDGNRLIRICNLLLEAFSLDHGLIYGGSWYSQRNLLLLLEVARYLVSVKESGASITLEDVDNYLSSPQCPNVKDAEQIRGIFRFLLEYQQLVGHADDEAIDLRRAIEDGEVIYAFLPAIAEATTARQIAGLLLQTTIAMAMKIYDEREGDPRPQRHVHIFVDEFPIIAGASYEALLTGARKFGVSLYMAYQTTESLQKDKATNLAAPVRDNTVLKMLFTVTGDQDIKELQAFSGETTRTTRSTPIGGSVTLQGRGAFGSGSVSEAVTPVLSKREILDISGLEGAFFAIIDDGLGQREPIPAIGSYAISKEDYLRFRVEPLPTVGKGHTIDEPKRLTKSALPSWRDKFLSTEQTKEFRERQRRFRDLVGRLKAEETPIDHQS